MIEIKRACKCILRSIQRKIYNRKHGTRIHSNKAALNADYGKNVGVGKNTFVSDDVTMGNYSYVNCNSSLENCRIGNYCSISSGVYINPYEHALEFRSTHPFVSKHAGRKRETVVIGHDVLISLNAIILSGVTIGNGAVIGAGAVVTRDVQPYEVVGGVPAKHIRWRFDEEERQRLEESGWYLKDMDVLEKNIPFFTKQTDAFCDENVVREGS